MLMTMAPGKEIEIPECKDIDVTGECHHGSQDVSHNVIHDDPDLVAAVRPVNPPDNYNTLFCWSMKVLPVLMTMNQLLPPQLETIQNLKTGRRNSRLMEWVLTMWMFCPWETRGFTWM